VWARLLETASTQDAPLLAASVSHVWALVERYISAINTAFDNESARIARTERAYRQEYVNRLFSLSTLTAEGLAGIEAALRLENAGPFTLLAVTEISEERLTEILRQRNRLSRIYDHERHGMTFVLWSGNDAESLPGLMQLPGGIVTGIASLVHVRRLSELAGALAQVANADDQAPQDLRHSWTRLVRADLDRRGLQLMEDIQTALEAARPSERDRLEETVREFLSSGSIQVTADRLYCHRNTVFLRLKRFEELTGVDPTVPIEAARLVVAWL
jgi:hypothetical protein